MKTFEFKIKTVTPLIMSGADTQTFELRETSIAGAMRYWYRKLYGSDNEKEIFGSTDKKGKFKLVVTIDEKNIVKPDNKRNYLLGVCSPKQWLKPEENWRLKIQTYIDNAELTERMIKSLLCAIYIGGIGSRSRRGYGSNVIEEPGFINIKSRIKLAITNESDVKKIFHYIIDSSKLSGKLKILGIPDNNLNKSIETLKNSTKKAGNVSIKTSINNIDELTDHEKTLVLAGEILVAYRSRLKEDYEVAKKALEEEIKNWKKEDYTKYIKKGKNSKLTFTYTKHIRFMDIHKSDFGVPIQFRFRSIVDKVKNIVEVDKYNISAIADEEIQRKRIRIPSRLFIRVIKVGKIYIPYFIFDFSRGKASKHREDLLENFMKSLENAGFKKVIP